MIHIVLNTRQKKIAQTLLEAGGTITISQLAERVNLSSRMVRYNLKTVEPWLRQRNIIVRRMPGIGINVEAPRHAIKNLLEKINETQLEEIVFTRDQRLRAITLILLTAAKPITTYAISSSTGVSRSTIVKDIRIIQNEMLSPRLNIKRREHVGMWVDGIESKRRSSIIKLIRQELGQEQWHDLWNINHHSFREILSDNPHIEQFLKSLPLVFTQKAVAWAEQALGHHLTPDARVTLQVYLAISIQANLEKHIIASSEQIDFHSPVEHQIAELIANQINSQFDISLNAAEISLISTYLAKSPKAISLPELINKEQKELDLNPESLELAKLVANQAATFLHPWLSVDRQLIRGLAFHFSSFTSSFVFPTSEIDPSLASQLVETFPYVHRIAKRAAVLLEQRLSITLPDCESHLIAMNFIAALERLRNTGGRRCAVRLVCNGEVSECSLLYSRLTTSFPDLDIIDLCMNVEALQNPVSDAELIISNTHINHPPLPLIVVSSILTQQDINSIQQWLYGMERQAAGRGSANSDHPSLIDLLDLSSIQVGVKVADWQEVVKISSEPLIKSKRLEPGYVQSMLKNLADFGPYMVIGPGVALLHAKPADGVNDLCMGLTLLQTGVDFGDEEYDPVNIVFVLGAIDTRRHLNALYQLVNLINNDTFRNELVRVESPAEALRVIWRYLPSIPAKE